MSNDNTQDEATPSPASAGSQPFAWAVTPTGKDAEIDCEFIYPSAATAGDVAIGCSGVVVPLYSHPQPTLTDEEREAVEVAAKAYADDHGERFAATLRALLSRTGTNTTKTDESATECRDQGVKCPERECLTDEEREAVEWAVGFCECTTSPLPTSDQIATLRGLLSRLSPPAT
jgi:hypothetical protein